MTDPLGHTTEYAYDTNGNLETETDGNGHKTKYVYDADSEPTKIEYPDGAITETGYDNEGQVTSQTDGNKHATKYVRNPLERVVEVVDPDERKTTEAYDAAGNVIKMTDPLKRTTTYTYNADNRLTGIGYSDGKTHSVEYEYNGDNDLTGMIDGTGTTSYTYDQLDRLTESKNGHGESVRYEYNLDNEPTNITYPNKDSVTRTYDLDGRLQTVTDWLGHQTKFAYNADSDLAGMTFPAGTGNQDKYVYNDADQMTEVKMAKGAETLASLAYTRDNDGQIQTTQTKGLPGEEKAAYSYDSNNRLIKAGTSVYGYDAANNPTKLGSSTYAYDNADQLKTGTGVKYAYNEAGQRLKSTPSGAATTYGYDEAGNLTSVERPAEGKTPQIKDVYTYDGNGLRASQTKGKTTGYLAWDTAGNQPQLLSDETNSYIYGPEGLPIEQINNSQSKVLYLHHDQQGSTRLITGSTGKAEATITYDPYGNVTGTTGTATSPLGYDGQYTSSDTGLVYLRARVYDPATTQFLSVDPAVSLTRAPYAYAGDNPVNHGDPTGLSAEGLEGVSCYFPFCGPPPPATEGLQHGLEKVEHGIESVWDFITEKEGPNDEGEAELREKEAQRAKECGEPNRGSLEKLKTGEIERILDEDGSDVHTDKEETVGKDAAGSYDYYRDKSTGEIYLIPKSGGEAIPTGLGG